jgi:hypothetical protein
MIVNFVKTKPILSISIITEHDEPEPIVLKNIVSAADQLDFSVDFDTPFASLNLPTQVAFTLDDASVLSIPVIWTGSYSQGVAGDYPLQGAPTLPDGVTNTDNVKASITVTVEPEAQTSTPNGLGEGIEITGLKSIWRVGQQDNFIITAPVGYQTQYQIIESESIRNQTWEIEKQGNNSGSIAHTFTTARKKYDIWVVVTKGTLRFERYLRFAITVLPPVFTRGQANVVINFATGGITYYMGNTGTLDKIGWKMWCEGEGTTGAYLGFQKFKSSVESDPVHCMADPVNGAKIHATGSYNLRFDQDCQNFLFDGCANPNVPYGFEMTMPSTGNHAQMCIMELSTSESTIQSAGFGIWMCGVKFLGGGRASAIVNMRTANSPTVNYDTFPDGHRNMAVFNCYMENNLDEGFYTNYVSDALYNGYAHCPITGARFYNNVIHNTGGDGGQLGASMRDCEFTGNTITGAGQRADPNHMNSIQLSSGNIDIFVYGNYVDDARNLMSIFTGRGGRAFYIFSNIFLNPRSDSMNHVNTFIRIDNNDYGNDIPAYMHGNTYSLHENKPLEVWNAQPTGITAKLNPFWYVNNAIVADRTTQMFTQNSPNQSGWHVNNYQVTSSATPKFRDYENKDFRALDLSSPLFQPIEQFDKVHPMQNYDVRGYGMGLSIQGAEYSIDLQT